MQAVSWKYVVLLVGLTLVLGFALGAQRGVSVWVLPEGGLAGAQLWSVHDARNGVVCYAVVPQGASVPGGVSISCVKVVAGR